MRNVIVAHNPFDMSAHIRERLTSGVTIAGWLRRHQKRVKLDGKAFIAFVNNDVVLRKDWGRRIQHGETLGFVALPAGGGSGGKDPLAAVASLAIMISAPYLATAMGFTGLAASATTVAIGLAGNLIVGTLFRPAAPALPEFGNTPAPSPTYALSARGNSARLGQPIPVLYGYHKIFPDLAAAPWSTYANNEQYVHQLLMIGQGEYDLSNIAIDDTPIANFTEITHQIIRPGGSITLFDPDYVTAPEVAGQELFYNKPIGGFVINPADTLTTEIQIDIVAPRGLYYTNTNGSLGSRAVSWRVEAQKIDNDGIATGSWVVLEAPTLSAATNTPQRNTYIYRVASGRYQVRVTRTSTDSTSARMADNIYWEAGRAKLSRSIDTSGVTLLALQMRATNNLSNRSKLLVSVTAHRKLPIWNGSSWNAPTATRSIAWAIADIARARYGGKLVDSRIDLAALKTLDGIWNARQDYFDAVFDANITVWEALNRAARCGRAGCYLQGGVLRIVRDQQQTLPLAMFTPRNIVKNSLKIVYRLSDEDTATAINVEFHNRRSWKNDAVIVSLDGDTTEPATVTMFGITSEAHAIREGRYLARANKYRRKAVTFTTESEGLIPAYGDLIRIIHQQPNWGLGGEVVRYDPASRTIHLSEPPKWGNATSGHLVLRNAAGSLQGSWPVTRGSSDDQVILPAAANPTIYTDGSRENTHYGFALTATDIGIDARVTGTKPRAKGQVEITALVEDSRVYLE